MDVRKPLKSTNFRDAFQTPILLLVAIASASVVHVLNRNFLMDANPSSLREGISVVTMDDPSYLRPAENFLAFSSWRSDAIGKRAYVLRSPGYGMLYAISISIFGQRNGLFFLIAFQFLLWAMAVATLPYLLQQLGVGSRVSFLLALFVAVSPVFSGFLNYTLTEAITPSLVVFFYAFLFRVVDGKESGILPAGMTTGFILLVRPALAVLLIATLPFFLKTPRRMAEILLLGLIPIVIWQIRVIRITGSPDLHPIYHDDSPGLYRPLHGEIWDFHKMTGQTGPQFHGSMANLWKASVGEMNEREAVARTLANLGPGVVSSVGRIRLEAAYYGYIDVLRRQVPFDKEGRPVDVILPGESHLIKAFDAIRRDYVGDHFVHAWLAVPLSVGKELIFHSNLSLYLFQKPLRGLIAIELIRYLSLAIHAFSFLIILFFGYRSPRFAALALPVLLYFLYLMFIQRGVEERYTLPFLLPAFSVAAATVNLGLRRYGFTKRRK